MQENGKRLKYSILMEYIKDEMDKGIFKPGDKIPSENELAKELSMSRHTVRNAISMLVNQGYLYTEHGRGSFCMDRSRMRKDSKNIGVITTYISEYIFPKVIQGIDSVLSTNGYSFILKNTNNDTRNEALCLEDIMEKNIEGLIIEPTKSALFSNNLKLYDALDRHNIPYVFIHGCYPKMEEKSCVILDDSAGTYAAVKHLINLGHKNIVGIFKADDIQGLNRHKGYARALNEAGLNYDPDKIIWFHTEDRDIKPFDVLRRNIEDKIKIDSVVCYNDEIAFKVYNLLSNMGIKVPQDISLTGFDDSYLSENCPVKITSLTHPKEKLGELAADILLQMMKDKNYLNNPIKKIIIPELIIKDSVIQR